jgi:di/tricarboxylate transporter
LLSIVAFLSQLALGGSASLIFFGWFVVNNLIIFSLSMRKNAGYGDINKVNIVCFALAITAIILWKTTSSPLVALITYLVADGIGAVLIVVKAFKRPKTETMSMWAMGSIATFLNILAVNSNNLSLYVAPIQIFLFNVVIVIAILLGRRLDKSNKNLHLSKVKTRHT